MAMYNRDDPLGPRAASLVKTQHYSSYFKIGSVRRPDVEVSRNGFWERGAHGMKNGTWRLTGKGRARAFAVVVHLLRRALHVGDSNKGGSVALSAQALLDERLYFATKLLDSPAVAHLCAAGANPCATNAHFKPSERQLTAFDVFAQHIESYQLSKPRLLPRLSAAARSLASVCRERNAADHAINVGVATPATAALESPELVDPVAKAAATHKLAAVAHGEAKAVAAADEAEQTVKHEEHVENAQAARHFHILFTV
eukprot:g207.t1